MRGATLVGGLAGALFLGAPSAVVPSPDPAADEPEAAGAATAEQRYEELARAFEARAAEVRAESGEENVTLLEAEEIARVADEILAEDDPDLAAALLEEALTLLGAPRAGP